MVAVIKTGHSLRRIFTYNENKVKEGVAECIGAGNYPLDPGQMKDAFKLKVLENQAALNDRVSRNSVHISLNFPVSESHLTNDQLREIAEDYMERIGFGEQPYLVYRHSDAGHPHVHIVSLKIQADGKRIETQNIGRLRSEPARKAIEEKYGLVSAEHQQSALVDRIKPISVKVIEYGKLETKAAIQNVLENVLTAYKYSSLAELNAVLKLYNVTASRGEEGSRVFKRGGLLYRVLDEQGKPIGIPIKASLFYNKPTLAFLDKQFVPDEQKAQHKAGVKNAIDIILLHQKLPLPQLVAQLAKQGISTVIRANEHGFMYGLTFVDHRSKCVFNGSDLGKNYSAKGLQERCTVFSATENAQGNSQQVTIAKDTGILPTFEQFQLQQRQGVAGKLLTELMQAEQSADSAPAGNARRKKRRKKTGKRQ